ncbi:rhodanese-related sulfurtransferase [Buchnera aphidicola (Macrosiphoniella sanborni)]|uniref:tRNA uridine(34) hydroxylase n=1 Tax=Buchnera aphidicola (Macrosiphoniella sanborni) TaxID=1241865 RepID=A0A4D6YD71_9GAMM|nr:rhodanese-related sulfurtransferase [Buchnera aphidicola]QCI23894.1 rhodanese-related sulfurtransferase [Buchnera aphidicola (Macrosiphoniella sanborni)]
MSRLHNVISKKELKKRMFYENDSRLTLSFYKYFTIIKLQEYRDLIYKFFYKYNFLGRVYIAEEGINAQISIPKQYYLFLKRFLARLDVQLKNLHINKALNYEKSFWFLSVKIKKKIVQDGIIEPFFHPQHVGIYIKAKMVNFMLHDNQTIFIDMRNSYEYAIGHFKNAIEIKSLTFREQLRNVIKLMHYAKNKNIVMYCTGGIRCEKATAWMLFNGFKNVYHIQGGILGYVHDAKKNGLPILFEGKNFVFDHRMSEKVSDKIISFCKQCNQPADTYINCQYNLCHLLFIQCHQCSIYFKKCCSLLCREKYIS